MSDILTYTIPKFTLTGVDWTILLIYFLFVVGVGFALKRFMKTSEDFFLSGKSIAAWITGLAFIPRTWVLKRSSAWVRRVPSTASRPAIFTGSAPSRR